MFNLIKGHWRPQSDQCEVIQLWVLLHNKQNKIRDGSDFLPCLQNDQSWLKSTTALKVCHKRVDLFLCDKVMWSAGIYNRRFTFAQ